MLVLVWICVAVILTFSHFKRYYDRQQIPSVPTKIWPYMGLLKSKFSMRLFAQNLMKNYKDIVYMEWLEGVTCFVFKPEWVKLVLSASNTRALMKPGASEGLGINGLAMVTGTTWAVHRKLIAPALLARSLKPFEVIVESKVHLLANRISDDIEATDNDSVKEDLYLLFKKLSLDTVGRIASGESMDSLYDRPDSVALQKDLDFLFEEVLNRMVAPIPYWRIMPFLPQARRVKSVHKKLWAIAERAVARKKKETFSDGSSVLDMLWEAHKSNPLEFPESEVVEETLSMLLGGAETIANVLSCVFYCLGQRPDVVEKIRNEINEKSNGQAVRVEDIKKYSYTDCTLKEVLRMYPVAFVVDRVATQDIQLGPYTIPKDTKILMPPVAIHYNEEVFPDPWTFNPDRFANREPSVGYFPFGGGLRICVGKTLSVQIIMLVILELVRRFDFKHVTKVPEIMNTAEAFNLRPPNVKLEMFVERVN
jgi:cytochrome P450